MARTRREGNGSSKPTLLKVNPAGIPQCLKELRPGLTWESVPPIDPNEGGGKWKKMPHRAADDYPADATNPDHYGTFEEVLTAMQSAQAGRDRLRAGDRPPGQGLATGHGA